MSEQIHQMILSVLVIAIFLVMVYKIHQAGEERDNYVKENNCTLVKSTLWQECYLCDNNLEYCK